MPIDLSELATAPPPKHPAPADGLVASPYHAPKEWQIAAPIEMFGGRFAPVQPSADLQRVLDLPRRPRVEPGSLRAGALIKHITAKYARQRTGPCRCREIALEREAIPKPCITEFNYAQAWTLHEIELRGGVLAHASVGIGKTVLDVLAAMALEPHGCKLCLLLVPPTLVQQLVTEYLLLAEHFRVPSMQVHRQPGAPHGQADVPGAPILHVLPYSRLSRPESTVFLENLRPDAIIADECHMLSAVSSVRTCRFLRYYFNHGDTKFCGWSGSITDDSLNDYCLDPATRVLTADLRWVPVGEVVVGDELVGFDEKLTETRMRRAAVQGVKRLLKPRIRLHTTAGPITCSTDHQWVLWGRARTYAKAGYSQTGTKSGRGRTWIEAARVRPGDLLVHYAKPWVVDESREAGYLAGLLDGEGWISGSMVGFAQNRGAVLDRYKSGLTAREFEFTERGAKVRNVFVTGDKAHLRLLGSLRPTRLLAKADKLWVGRAPLGLNSKPVRVLAVEELEPGEVCAVQTSTGTMVAEGLLSHNCHLSALALQYGSPLPLDKDVLDDWARAIDPSDAPAPPGALIKLCEAGEHVHDAFHRRLVDTPGFVVTSGASIDADMEITERAAPPVPDVPLADPRSPGIPGICDVGYWPGVLTCLNYLRETWQRPDGEELVDALSVGRCARELACGLFLRWKFVHGETQEQIDEWLEARKCWRKELRKKIQAGEPHLDSPMLCANAAMRAWGNAAVNDEVDLDEEGQAVAATVESGLPQWRAVTWPRWHACKNTVRPETEAVRIDDYLARDAAAWGLENTGIIWYATVAFGNWVAEISGLPQHAGGNKAAKNIARETGKRSIVASIKSHGTGRDGLQRLFSTQLVAQPPSSATAWEQLLGRLSRIGQEAKVIRAELYRHTEELASHVDAALRKALYVQTTLGSPQKLRAGWRMVD